MIRNTASYPIGCHLILKRDTHGTDSAFEVEVLEKSDGWIKVRIVTEGWFAVGNHRWLFNSQWSVLAKLPPSAFGEDR